MRGFQRYVGLAVPFLRNGVIDALRRPFTTLASAGIAVIVAIAASPGGTDCFPANLVYKPRRERDGLANKAWPRPGDGRVRIAGSSRPDPPFPGLARLAVRRVGKAPRA